MSPWNVSSQNETQQLYQLCMEQKMKTLASLPTLVFDGFHTDNCEEGREP